MSEKAFVPETLDGRARFSARFVRGAGALIVGMALGACMAVAIYLGPFNAAKFTIYLIRFYIEYIGSPTLSVSMSANITQAVWEISLLTSISIVLVATPVWLIAERFGRGTMANAALLGALLAAGAALIVCLGGRDWGDPGAWSALMVYGLAGAASGAATWRLSHPSSERSPVT